MIPTPLKTCERALRKAVARRRYDEVTCAMDELRRVADQALRGTTDTAERLEITGWILATIEWARLMIVTQRHSWAEELAQFPRVDRFIDASGTANPEVCLDL